MKIYEEKPKTPKKSWALKLRQETSGIVTLYAVDSITGENIAALINFGIGGKIGTVISSATILKNAGYDPYEYNNEWSTRGEIVVT